MAVERSREDHPVRHRLGPTVLTFLVVAGAVYATAYLALSLLRHVVMPVVAVVAGFYAARVVFRVSGR